MEAETLDLVSVTGQFKQTQASDIGQMHVIGNEAELEYRRLLHLRSLGGDIALVTDSPLGEYAKVAEIFGMPAIPTVRSLPNQILDAYRNEFGFSPSYVWRGRGRTAADLTPSAADLTPSAADLTPSAADFTPSAVDLTPSAADFTPSAADLTPSAADFTPSAVDFTPSAADLTPSAM